MCLGIPGQIMSEAGEGITRTGKVCFGGIIKEVNLAYTPEARTGDYVIVHVGFAISRLDEKEAARTLAYLEEMDELQDLENKS